jgi:hypothetical protein
LAVFSDLVPARKREVGSAVAHHIAGVLDREIMVEIVEGLCETAAFKPGDRVKTLRGSTRGVVLRQLTDGRVVWRPDESQPELIALPEGLLRAVAAGSPSAGDPVPQTQEPGSADRITDPPAAPA